MSFLNIDSTKFQNKLLLNKDSNYDDPLSSLMDSVSNKPQVPTKLVTPAPGICVKTYKKSDGEKVFINICHTSEIPPPKGNTIPMSIGHQKQVLDKSGAPCIAFDVAINSGLFDRIRNEIVTWTVINGVAEKHGLEFDENNYQILRNVKCKGKIDPMNIEQRSPKTEPRLRKPLIYEIESEQKSGATTNTSKLVPNFNLIKVSKPNEYYGSEIDLKDVTSKKDIELHIGEDRIYLTTKGKVKYTLEYHVPENINCEHSSAEFDPLAQVLTIIAPINK